MPTAASKPLFTLRLIVLALCAGSAAAAGAATTLYTDAAAFAAASTTSLLITFDDIAIGSHAESLSTGGLLVQHQAGAIDVFIAPVNSGYFGVANTTQVLTANADENFRFSRADGAAFTAIGFDFYSNPYGAPGFYLFNASGTLIDKFSVAQTPSTLGFIGFTSTVPIAYMTSIVDRGSVVDTGFDNMHVGAAPVPEPASALLVLAGLLVLSAAARRAP